MPRLVGRPRHNTMAPHALIDSNAFIGIAAQHPVVFAVSYIHTQNQTSYEKSLLNFRDMISKMGPSPYATPYNSIRYKYTNQFFHQAKALRYIKITSQAINLLLKPLEKINIVRVTHAWVKHPCNFLPAAPVVIIKIKKSVNMNSAKQLIHIHSMGIMEKKNEERR